MESHNTPALYLQVRQLELEYEKQKTEDLINRFGARGSLLSSAFGGVQKQQAFRHIAAQSQECDFLELPQELQP